MIIILEFGVPVMRAPYSSDTTITIRDKCTFEPENKTHMQKIVVETSVNLNTNLQKLMCTVFGLYSSE